MNLKSATEDPILALATPWGESAIAILRLSGGNTLEILESAFRGRQKVAAMAGHSLNHGMLLNPADGSAIDEVMLAVFRAPRSYTGEDSAEIYCHGSLAILHAAMAALLAAGFRQAGPGEFTQRAFLNGKLDLTRAEAVNEIIRARSGRARALALNRLSGGITRRIDSLKGQLADLLCAVEVLIDYPEEQIQADTRDWLARSQVISTDLKRLLGTYHTGRIIQEGVSMVIAGRTNAGKSTLFNLLLREDRAIVSDVHGTTRDYLEGQITINGVPIRLFDTAGLRESGDPVEQEGMRRTDQLIGGAVILLYVADGTCGLNQQEQDLLDRYRDRTQTILIWNKCDAGASPCPTGALAFSALRGSGLEELHRRITAKLIDTSCLESGEPVIDSARQKKLLEQCAASLAAFNQALEQGLSLDLLAVDLKEALDCLGEITGEVTSEELLQRMFSNFCVGK